VPVRSCTRYRRATPLRGWIAKLTQPHYGPLA